MKDEVPTQIIDSHVKAVDDAIMPYYATILNCGSKHHCVESDKYVIADFARAVNDRAVGD